MGNARLVTVQRNAASLTATRPADTRPAAATPPVFSQPELATLSQARMFSYVRSLLGQREELRRQRLELATLTSGSISPFADLIEQLGRQITQLTAVIQAMLEHLGSTEAEVRDSSAAFANLWLARAEQVASRLLTGNQTALTRQLVRYGNDAEVADLQMADATLAGVVGRHGPADQSTRDQIGQRHPILYCPGYRPGILTNRTPTDVRGLLLDWSSQIRSNITETRENIRSGELALWDCPVVAELTWQELGMDPTGPLGAPIRERAAATGTGDLIRTSAMITLGLAAILTGVFIPGVLGAGAALLLNGAAGALAVGQAVGEIQHFQAEQAASQVALDPELADLSAQDPSIGRLVMALVGVGLSGVGLASGVRAVLRQAALARPALDVPLDTAKLTQELVAAGGDPRAVAQLLTEVTAELKAEQQLHRLIMIEIRAHRYELRMAAVRLLNDQLAEHTHYIDLARRLLAANRVLPADPALVARMTVGHPNQARLVIAARELARRKLDGGYDPVSGYVFVPGGVTAEDTAVTLAHEATHWVQHAQGIALTPFEQELEAIIIQQQVSRALTGKLHLPLARQLDEMTEVPASELPGLISRSWGPGYQPPAGFDATQAITPILAKYDQWIMSQVH